MITAIPDNWSFNDSLEMLYLFYQKTDELLSETTPDTYALPLHNALTLIAELSEVLSLLNKYSMLTEYYAKYVPPIIEEFLDRLEDDYILKQILGSRLFSIRTGFLEAINTHLHVNGWIDIFRHACPLRKYREAYVEEIIRLITNTKDKSKLLYCIENYFVILVRMGYSREYLYVMTKKFFSSQSALIERPEQIKEYLDFFTCKKERHDFLILMDVNSIEYMDGISDNLVLSKQIQKVDIEKERKELCKDYSVEVLFKEYDQALYQKTRKNKMAIVRFYDNELDPYCAAIKFCDYIRVLQTFTRYFKHYHFSKQVFKILHADANSHYKELKVPNNMLKRPYVKQEIIDQRIGNILQAKAMTPTAFNSLTRAILMHSEAFDSRSTTTQIRTFWTALEMLFSNPTPNTVRSNVITSVLQIVQKTYTLKIFRAVYSQLNEAIETSSLHELGITSFTSFMEYFASYRENSAEMKKIYHLLSENPLLRSRFFFLRHTLGDGASISKYLEKHRTRVEWQLKRLYRIRNIATHLGVEVSGANIAINHLHNYFDFVVNYMLCKSENGDYIASTAAVVFEAQNDNRIYHELLKENAPLSAANYKKYLFGPDSNLINYKFEH